MTEYVTTLVGDRVGYDRRGEGPAVVFVAGAGPFRAMDPQTTETAELLAERGFTTVVYDRVGRADSFRPGRVGLQDEMAAVASMIEIAGGRAVLCGHSSGCAISLRAAVEGLPVDGLVLFEAPLDPATLNVHQWTGELYRLLDVGDAAGAVTHYMKDIPLEVLAGLQDSPMWEPFVAHAESLRADAEALEWAMSAPHAELFGALDVSALVVVGEDLPRDAGGGRLTCLCPARRRPRRGRRRPALLGPPCHGQPAYSFCRRPRRAPWYGPGRAVTWRGYRH